MQEKMYRTSVHFVLAMNPSEIAVLFLHSQQDFNCRSPCIQIQRIPRLQSQFKIRLNNLLCFFKNTRYSLPFSIKKNLHSSFDLVLVLNSQKFSSSSQRGNNVFKPDQFTLSNFELQMSKQ